MSVFPDYVVGGVAENCPPVAGESVATVKKPAMRMRAADVRIIMGPAPFCVGRRTMAAQLDHSRAWLALAR
jgi:hypothetical protein